MKKNETRENNYKEVCRILDSMRENSYLVPQGFTSEMEFTDSSGDSYKLYCNDSRDYICVYLYGNEKSEVELTFSRRGDKWEIEPKGLLFEINRSSINKQEKLVVDTLTRIYNEIYSLNVDKTLIKAIKKEIRENKKDIAIKKNEIKLLEKRLEDSLEKFEQFYFENEQILNSRGDVGLINKLLEEDNGKQNAR